MLAGEQTFRYLILASRRMVRSPDRGCHRRDAFREMLNSIVANGHTFDECKELLKNCTFADAFLRVGSLIGY